MKTVFLLSLLLVASQAFFEQWMVQYNKTYATTEEKLRRKAIYGDNLKRIAKLSAENPRTRFGVNKFADLTEAEFAAQYLSPKPMIPDRSVPMAPLKSQQELDAMPASWDWRTKGAVTPVKNQGGCGSCWTFSTTGNVEGMWFLAGHSLVGLSEQNLVDCDHDCVNDNGQQACDAGCNGGLMTTAFGFIMKQGGIDSESSYPYLGFDSTCDFAASNIAAKISNYTTISSDETQMAAWLAAHGPISIAVDAGGVWQFYMGGVLYAPCGTTLDHGVLLVGYGTETDIFDQTMPYWTIKNSWGGDWGDDGYIYIERGTGKCGVNLFPCSSII